MAPLCYRHRFPPEIIQQAVWLYLASFAEVAPDNDVGVLQTRGEHADPHLAPPRFRQGSVDHLQPVGTAEAPDLNNPVARLSHGADSWQPMIQLAGRKDRNRCQAPP
jgi:hypothetical protein